MNEIAPFPEWCLIIGALDTFQFNPDYDPTAYQDSDDAPYLSVPYFRSKTFEKSLLKYVRQLKGQDAKRIDKKADVKTVQVKLGISHRRVDCYVFGSTKAITIWKTLQRFNHEPFALLVPDILQWATGRCSVLPGVKHYWVDYEILEHEKDVHELDWFVPKRANRKPNEKIPNDDKQEHLGIAAELNGVNVVNSESRNASGTETMPLTQGQTAVAGSLVRDDNARDTALTQVPTANSCDILSHSTHGKEASESDDPPSVDQQYLPLSPKQGTGDIKGKMTEAAEPEKYIEPEVVAKIFVCDKDFIELFATGQPAEELQLLEPAVYWDDLKESYSTTKKWQCQTHILDLNKAVRAALERQYSEPRFLDEWLKWMLVWNPSGDNSHLLESMPRWYFEPDSESYPGGPQLLCRDRWCYWMLKCSGSTVCNVKVTQDSITKIACYTWSIGNSDKGNPKGYKGKRNIIRRSAKCYAEWTALSV